MKKGDLVRHKGGSGWQDMEGKIGVLINRCPEPYHERWYVKWCCSDITPFNSRFRWWGQHLEVISENR